MYDISFTCVLHLHHVFCVHGGVTEGTHHSSCIIRWWADWVASYVRPGLATGGGGTGDVCTKGLDVPQ